MYVHVIKNEMCYVPFGSQLEIICTDRNTFFSIIDPPIDLLVVLYKILFFFILVNVIYSLLTDLCIKSGLIPKPVA